MSAQPDEAVIRQFIEIISAHAVQLTNGAGNTGYLQLDRISPIDERTSPTRFKIDDIERMIETAVGDAVAGYNVYIEGRAVRPGLNGSERGKIEDTTFVFALVVDSDADKGKGGNVTVRPSLAITTSPGNYHLWYFLSRAVSAAEARKIGDAIRAASGADQDTGVITQCYRVPGTPNFPGPSKRARGRVAVESTGIYQYTGRLWDPDELLAAFSAAQPSAAPSSQAQAAGTDDESTLPDDLLEAIRTDLPKGQRSEAFHSVIAQLKKRNWSVDAIVALLEKYPNGIANKFIKRLRGDRGEVRRSYDKIAATAPNAGAAGGAPPPPPPSAAAAPAAGAAPGAGAGAGVAPAPHVLPTIRLVDGRLPDVVAETERALVASGEPIYSRGGVLVEPVSETMAATSANKTMAARLRELCPFSLLEPVARSAVFQKYSQRRRGWVDVDPPLQLVRMLLARERRWIVPHVSGIITTPTLRFDGSLLAAPGYDPQSELYLLLGMQPPSIPEHPTREEAEEALKLLIELFSEFPFKDEKLDRAVALSGLLTAMVRGSLPTAPIHLIRASTPGTGKSYLVDLISMIAMGRLCPVITTSSSPEETEKRIGSVILSGIPIISLDNCTHDLGGELMCQLSERPVIKIRILGRSETPDCESHTAVFATGNNITFYGDMDRRGVVCNFEALDERPELREFQKDALGVAAADRGKYVAAALTIIRAYITAGSPKVCSPFNSYAQWTDMVRAPLVWLGETDPVVSTETIRDDDPVLNSIRGMVECWISYDLGLGTPITTGAIIDAACAQQGMMDFNPPVFEQFLLQVASSTKDPTEISRSRLALWLTKISGRVVGIKSPEAAAGNYRLVRSQRNAATLQFCLEKIDAK
jgi:hypothetical protein